MKTFSAPEFSDFPERLHFSPALDTGDFVFFSGVTGYRPDGTFASDPEQQIRDTFEFLNATLKAAGLDFTHVVEMTSYHVGMRDQIKAFSAVKDAFVDPPYPAWTAVGVVELMTPGAIVEIRVIAKRP